MGNRVIRTIRSIPALAATTVKWCVSAGAVVLVALALAAPVLLATVVSPTAMAAGASTACSQPGDFCIASTNGSIVITFGSLSIPFTGLGGNIDGLYYSNTNADGQNLEFPISGMNFPAIKNPSLMGIPVTGTVTLQPTTPALATFNAGTGTISGFTLNTNIVVNTTAPIQITNCAIPESITGMAATVSGGTGTLDSTISEAASTFETEVEKACPTLAGLISGLPSSGTGTATIKLPFTLSPSSPSPIQGTPATPSSTSPSISPDSSPASGGGVVTISGPSSVLSGAKVVDFGTVPATGVTQVSPTEVTATVPPASSPGTVPVTVTTSGAPNPAGGFVYTSTDIPYTPVTPYRILDTRCALGASALPSGYCSQLPTPNLMLLSPGSGTSLEVAVGGTGSGTDSVPTNAQSVVLNVTAAASPESPAGFLTIYPYGTNPPTASSLNYVPGDVVPNLVTVALGEGGQIAIYSSASDVDLIVDVEGYYAPSTPQPTKLNPLSAPERILDTRCANSTLSFCAGEKIPSANAHVAAPGHNSTVKVQVAGVGSIPNSGIDAASLVVTAASPASSGYLTVWPDGEPRPSTSNVNFVREPASANSVTVSIPSDGAIDIFNSAGAAVNVIVDINGYFAATGEAFNPSSPMRICDTRSVAAVGGTGDVTAGVSGACGNGGTMPAKGSTTTVAVGNIGAIPSNAKIVVANITVADTVAGSGYLTAWPAGTTQPSTSNVNWSKGQVIPNMVVSGLNGSGQMDMFVSAPADVIIDVVGWYS